MKTHKEIEDLKNEIGLKVQQLQYTRNKCDCEDTREELSFLIGQKMAQYNILIEVLK